MAEKRNIRVDVYGDPIDTTLVNCIARLDELLNSIPDEFRSEVKVETDYDTHYECTSAFLNVYYYRPETDEEFETRLEKEKQNIEDRKLRLQKELEQLNAIEFQKPA